MTRPISGCICIVFAAPVVLVGCGATPSASPPPVAQVAPTGDPFVAQVTAFTDPILASVSARPPDHHDDFSNPYSGWETKDGSHRCPRPTTDGESGYERGEYYVEARMVCATAGQDTCHLGVGRGLPDFSDFVMQLDGRVSAGTNGSWHVFFRGGNNSWYDVAIYTNGSLTLAKRVDGVMTALSSRTPSALRGGTETNTLKIVAQGSRLTVLVNDQPAAYAEDSTHRSGYTALNVCNTGPTTYRAYWDNLSVWDLPNR